MEHDQEANQGAGDAGSDSSPGPESPTTPDAAAITKKLDEILQQLRQLTRLRQHRDFSLTRLIAVVVQLVVVALVFWIAVGLVELPRLDPLAETWVKLLAATLLQLLALTCFVLDRQER